MEISKEPIGFIYLGGVCWPIHEGDYCPLYDIRSDRAKYRYHIIELYPLLQQRPEFAHILELDLIKNILEYGERNSFGCDLPRYNLRDTALVISYTRGITCQVCNHVSYPQLLHNYYKGDRVYGTRWSSLSRVITKEVLSNEEFNEHNYRHSLICETCADLVMAKIYKGTDSYVKNNSYYVKMRLLLRTCFNDLGLIDKIRAEKEAKEARIFRIIVREIDERTDRMEMDSGNGQGNRCRTSYTLTDTRACRLKAPITGRVTYWDILQLGFGLRITSKNKRSWVCNYRINGKSVLKVISSVENMPSADKARLYARWSRIKAKEGVDPSVAREELYKSSWSR